MENIELEEKSLLRDVKTAFRKRKYRRIIQEVEKKIDTQDIVANLSAKYLLQILNYETSAAHQLLLDCIIGKIEKIPQIFQSLLAIYLRNLQISYLIFAKEMQSKFYNQNDQSCYISSVKGFNKLQNSKALSYLHSLMTNILKIFVILYFSTKEQRLKNSLLSRSKIYYYRILGEMKDLKLRAITEKYKIIVSLILMNEEIKGGFMLQAQQKFYYSAQVILKSLIPYYKINYSSKIHLKLSYKIQLQTFLLISLFSFVQLKLLTRRFHRIIETMPLLKYLYVNFSKVSYTWKKFTKETIQRIQILKMKIDNELLQFAIPYLFRKFSFLKNLFENSCKSSNAFKFNRQNYGYNAQPCNHFNIKCKDHEAIESLSEKNVKSNFVTRTDRKNISFHRNKENTNKSMFFNQEKQEKRRVLFKSSRNSIHPLVDAEIKKSIKACTIQNLYSEKNFFTKLKSRKSRKCQSKKAQYLIDGTNSQSDYSNYLNGMEKKQLKCLKNRLKTGSQINKKLPEYFTVSKEEQQSLFSFTKSIEPLTSFFTQRNKNQSKKRNKLTCFEQFIKLLRINNKKVIIQKPLKLDYYFEKIDEIHRKKSTLKQEQDQGLRNNSLLLEQQKVNLKRNTSILSSSSQSIESEHKVTNDIGLENHYQNSMDINKRILKKLTQKIASRYPNNFHKPFKK